MTTMRFLTVLILAVLLIPSGAFAYQIKDHVQCYEAGMMGPEYAVSDPTSCATCTNNGGTWETEPKAGEPACSNPNKPAPKPEAAKLVNLLPPEAWTLEGLISVVMKAVVQIGSILLVLALIWTGFLFIQAQGKEEQIRSARQALMWTVLGGLLLLGAQTLSLIISSSITTL